MRHTPTAMRLAPTQKWLSCSAAVARERESSPDADVDRGEPNRGVDVASSELSPGVDVAVASYSCRTCGRSVPGRRT